MRQDVGTMVGGKAGLSAKSLSETNQEFNDNSLLLLLLLLILARFGDL